MILQKGDIIRLEPDADVSLSYKEGSPPSSYIKNELWIVDAIEDLDDVQNLNISTFEPDNKTNAGSYCSWVLNTDVKEVVKRKNNLTEKILKEAEEESNEPLDYNKLLTTKEDLHPDLKSYFTPGGNGSSFPMIRHPLVYSMFHTDQQNALVNKQYEYKSKRVQQALKEKDFGAYIYMHERPYRLDAFMDVMSQMPDKEYWEELGSIWTDTENAWQNLATWKKLFKSKRPGREFLMNPEELKVYKKLPAIVTVYRGHNNKNKNGISYSLDPKKAEWFSKRFGNKDNSQVTKLKVPKNKIVAYFSGRGESEVIVV